MAKKGYIGVGGKARWIRKGYIGVYQDTVVNTHGLPSGYTELKWIEGTGTQYVDTGISGGTKAAYVISFNALSTVNVTYETYFGGLAAPPCPKLLEHENSMVNSQTTGDNTAIAGMDTDLVVRYDADGRLYVNGAHKLTYTSGAGWGDRTWRVFNGHEDTDLIATMRLYALKMWTNGTLVRNFIPAKRNSGGAIGLYDLANAQFYTNAGTGAFTAGPVVTDTPAGSYARRIRKGYIGIGGVARPCWISGGTPAYYGEIAACTGSGPRAGAGYNGAYAVIGGEGSTAADAYNDSLTHFNPSKLTMEAYETRGADIGEYVLLGGGQSNTTLDVYDKTLAKTTAPALSRAKYSAASASGKNYAIFAAGYPQDTNVDAYSESLVKSTSTISASRWEVCGAATSEYMFVGGGRTGDNIFSSAVDAIDNHLTRSTPTALSVARARLSAAGSDKYVLFAGGCDYQFSGASSAVDGYDNDLTRISVTPLSTGRQGCTGVGLQGNFLFGLGYSDSAQLNTTEVYDEALTKITTLTAAKARWWAAGVEMRDYALMARGWDESADVNLSQVDAYTLV